MAGYRPPYTLEEKQKILEYIVKEEAYYDLRGRAFWKRLEATGELNRTWQSMKEHFRMQIVPVLMSDSRLDISKEEKTKILNSWNVSKQGYVQKSQSRGINLEEYEDSEND